MNPSTMIVSRPTRFTPISPRFQGKSRSVRLLIPLGALAFGLFLGGCLPPRTVITPPEIIKPDRPPESGETAESSSANQRRIEYLIRKLEETERSLLEAQRKTEEALQKSEKASRTTEEAAGRIEKAQEKIENINRKNQP